ncbi:MAG TPA: LysR family transcriptional regulator [Pseudomonas sp.]|uniref:LysR family transcriptional regulator n=1 Tax=Pseudomonas sp. TaxID=306 RepID=UPI002EDA69BD
MIGVATPTLSRQLQQLETHLGVALLNRTTRQLSLTPAYSDRCRVGGEIPGRPALTA